MADRTEIGALQALYDLRDAALDAFGNPEDCEDCGAISDSGEGDGCRLHTGTELAAKLSNGIEAAEDVLGPCVCGHARSEHWDCDERVCKTKGCCPGFRLPSRAVLSALSPGAGAEKAFDFAALVTERDHWRAAYDKANAILEKQVEGFEAMTERAERAEDRLREISDLLADADVPGGTTIYGGVLTLRDRAEKAEARCAELERSLRRYAIVENGGTGDESDWLRCRLCRSAWRTAENHKPTCLLAALKSQESR